MLQVKEMTHEEKVKMHSKLKKKELIEMLIEANRNLDWINESNIMGGSFDGSKRSKTGV